MVLIEETYSVSRYPFDLVAPLYDRLMESMDYERWCDNYVALLSATAPVERLLELGCGTGLMTRAFLRRALQVHGVDRSAEMLAYAEHRCAPWGDAVSFAWGDFESYRCQARYDGVVAPFDVLNYALSPEALLRALQTAATHLHPGQPLLFDVNTAYAFEMKMFDEEEVGPNAELRHWWCSRWEAATRIVQVQMYFIQGEEVIHECQQQRAHSAEEISQAMTCAGFTDVTFFDAATLSAPLPESDRIYVRAVKA